jgi:hypothetical protein
MLSAMDRMRAEPTGWGSVQIALSMAVAMISIVSGGKDACEKSFMRSDHVELLIAKALHEHH